jgi:hypothetical protein
MPFSGAEGVKRSNSEVGRPQSSWRPTPGPPLAVISAAVEDSPVFAAGELLQVVTGNLL